MKKHLLVMAIAAIGATGVYALNRPGFRGGRLV